MYLVQGKLHNKLWKCKYY